MKAKRLIAVVLIVCLLLCAGCGEQTQEAAQPEAPQQEPAAETQEPADEWLEAENVWRLICPSYSSAEEAAAQRMDNAARSSS